MTTTFRPHFRRLSLLVACSLTAFAAARGHDHYRVIELGALGATLSYANSINASGVVVGNVQYADGHVQAFVWDAKNGIRRVDPTARQSVANWISDSAIVAGAVEDENRIVDAVLWREIGVRESIAWAPFGAFALSVNRMGQAVGYREDGIFNVVVQAFAAPATDPNSAWTDLFDLDHESFATAINDRGQIVGSVDRQAFVIDRNGRVRILAGSPDSGPPAMAVAINNHGDVLVSQLGNAFIVAKSSTRIPLQYGAPVFPKGINDKDEVVGFVDNGNQAGFVWDRSSGLILLDTLVDTPGWKILSANSINRNGLIAGFGVKNGRQRAVLLVPVKRSNQKAKSTGTDAMLPKANPWAIKR